MPDQRSGSAELEEHCRKAADHRIRDLLCTQDAGIGGRISAIANIFGKKAFFHIATRRSHIRRLALVVLSMMLSPVMSCRYNMALMNTDSKPCSVAIRFLR